MTKLNTVDGLRICDACLDCKREICDKPGCVQICHTPGCLMTRHRPPDLPIRKDIILAKGTIVPNGSGGLTARTIVDRLLAIDRIGEAVTCSTCGRRKTPIGRDDPGVSYQCNPERGDGRGCHGYSQDPRPQQLHPGERASEFGYGGLTYEDVRAVLRLISDVRQADDERREMANEAFDTIGKDPAA